jgi:uncharacterized protein
MMIGVVSDTHGLVRPELVTAIKGSDLILHAGDIGSADVLVELGAIAPVVAVRGNNDNGKWADQIPLFEVTEVDGVHIYMLHDINELDLDPSAAGFRVVISGHSHRPALVEKNGILFLNPGSAGPRRFKLPVSAARLEVRGDKIRGELIQLPI